MQTKTRSATQQDDLRVLNATLRKLQIPGWILRIGIIAGIAMIWFWICQQILHLGSMLTYEGLEALGSEVVSFLTRINLYLWWGVIVILSLIVLSVVRTWLLRSLKRARTMLVSVADVQNLASSMSQEGIQVLKWVWDSTNDPVTVGDLIVTRQEIRSGRIRKLAMAQAQVQALELGTKPDAFNLRNVRAEPLMKTHTIKTPVAGDKIEPVL